MTFSLIQTLSMGLASSVLVGLLATVWASNKERQKWAIEINETANEWRAANRRLVREHNYDLKREGLKLEKAKGQRDHYKKGLEQIGKRKYLQIGQMKAPGATFSPPWEIAEEYLKKGSN